MDEQALSERRLAMCREDLAARGISPRTIQAFATTPRELFLPPDLEPHAYADRPLPIGEGQTISQPYIVAVTTDALGLQGGERVLEIGTGSGYAAAIFSALAREVHTVERIGTLAHTAARRLSALGLENVHVHVGDGSLGLPSHAPYDAIAVAASGAIVPQALLDQLAVGGRLVMPVVDASGVGERLVRVTRSSENSYDREDLEPVQFVPLIGARGFPRGGEEGALARARLASGSSRATRIVREIAEPFDDLATGDIDRLVDRLASARVVLIGESSHGTSEFYRLRGRITRALIERHGFAFVSAEADWPDAARIDDYVLGDPPRTRVRWPAFERFPTWMWRNEEVSEHVEWLRAHNARRSTRVGFHGLDMYSLYTSIAVVLSYLEEVDPSAAALARERYSRLLPWHDEPRRYALAVARGRLDSAEGPVIATLRDLLARRLEYIERDGARFFDAAQNARLVASAERYYRAMFRGSAQTWNLRDSHMFETLRSLLAYYGPGSKGVVWAHNSHVGDARATEMFARKEHNLGQLCRHAFGDAARLVGMSTYEGRVAAASSWGDRMQTMTVVPGHPESYEHVMHAAHIPAFVLPLREPARREGREELGAARLFRAIGVIYRPDTELESHYQLSVLPEQFDELVWIDRTEAVTPLPPPSEARALVPDTYPFGL